MKTRLKTLKPTFPKRRKRNRRECQCGVYQCKHLNMTQVWLLWWPKHPTTTTIKVHGDDDVQQVAGSNIIGYRNTTTTTTIGASTFASASSSSSSSHCSCVSKLVRKLKRNFRTLASGLTITSTTPHHQGGSKYLQCRYDPLSYSLNFDSSGSGCGNLDEDYYHFYAFSSRFVANPTSCPRLLLPATATTTTTTTTTTTSNTTH